MKAIVTGGAGFIGSHLVEELLRQGFEVHIIDNLSTGKRENVPSEAFIHVLDICSTQVRSLIINIKPDFVFHLAAQADVTTSINRTIDDANINIIGTINLLEACKVADVKKFIFASTSAVYGEIQKERITETDLTRPISYYGHSKLTAEKYIELYNRYFQIPYTILRYGNVYGPRQIAKGEGGVIAIFINNVTKKEPLIVYGDGEQTRDFIHVFDVVQANLAAMEKGHNEIIHVSTGKPTSINEIIINLKQLHDNDIQVVYKTAKPGDIKHSCLNNEKADSTLNLAPLYTIYNGLKHTYLFESKNINNNESN